MSKKIKDIYINVDIFHTDVFVLIGDKEHVLEWAKKNILHKMYIEFKEGWESKSGKESIKDSTQGMAVHLNGGGTIVWVRSLNMVYLMHELAHVQHHLLRTKGIELNDETTEVYAYLTDYFYRCITKALK